MDKEIQYFFAEERVRSIQCQLLMEINRRNVQRSRGLEGKNVEVNIFMILFFECVFSFIKIISSTCLPYFYIILLDDFTFSFFIH